MAVTINGSTGVQLDDNDKQEFGTGDDLKIYHDGSNSYLVNTTGFLKIKDESNVRIDTDAFAVNKGDNSETMIVATADAGVDLYYNNVKILETENGYANVTGYIQAGDGTHSFMSSDGNKSCWGNDQDLKIYHNGSNSYIDDSGTGALIFKSNTYSFRNAADNEQIAKFTEDGAVELYHNNDKQFEVDSAGTKVYDHDSTVQTQYHTNGSTVCGYIYGENDDNLGFLDKNGNWRIRATDAGYQLYGSNHSDRDLKENITTISGSSLDKLNKLTAKSYNWKATESGKIDTSQTYVGFIAQEVQPHFPELVSGTDGKKDMGLDYSGLYAHAIKAIQELSAEVETLKTKVAALEAHTHE